MDTEVQKAKMKLIPSGPSAVFVAILLSLLIAFCRSADGHPTETLMENDRTEPPEIGVDLDIDEVDYDRKEVLENLQKIFGIRGEDANTSIRQKIPPQFMTELYKMNADFNGATRGENPYNARIVRSYVERETLMPQHYLFEVSGMETNESIIKAELHLFRKPSDYIVVDPRILKSPYYLIRVYQVLEGQSLNEPDVHRLLNVHYVGAHASGWQVFNVKQAVLAWLSGAPNLGLLVTASTLFGDEVTIEFTRRNLYNPSKQPILVLFNDDGRSEKGTSDATPGVPPYYSYKNEEEETKDELVENDTDSDRGDVERPAESDDDRSGSTVGRQKRQQDESEVVLPVAEFEDSRKKAGTSRVNRESNKEVDYGTQLGNNLGIGQSEIFQRQKRIDSSVDFSHFKSENYLAGESRDGKKDRRIRGFIRRARSTNSVYPKRATSQFDEADGLEFVTEKRKNVPHVLSSMDIYERAMLRRQMKKSNLASERKGEKAKQKILGEHKKRRMRFPREVEEKQTVSDAVSAANANNTGCARRELYISFDAVGFSKWIIAPDGYDAFQCGGRCDSSHDQQITNHGRMRELVHKLGLVKDVNLPCCVPTKFRGMSVLYFDQNDNVVLKKYDDIIVERCECR